jgi:transcription elongation factor Elf1
MGRRKKAAKKVVKKKRPTVAKIFKCLFCNHEKSVTCSLDVKSRIGALTCSVCDAKYQTQIHDLTEPIDIFTEWLDETSDAQARAAKKFMLGKDLNALGPVHGSSSNQQNLHQSANRPFEEENGEDNDAPEDFDEDDD